MLSYPSPTSKTGGIAIVGVGGAGANILRCFAASSAENVSLYTLSLDERVGKACGNVQFIQLGKGISRGLGSGGDPDVGRHAMEEAAEQVTELLESCKLMVMVVGLGGGTGSGAAPVLAHMAHKAGIFLVSVIMLPFSFEGKRRREQAEKAHEEIARLSDIVFCFENDYMEELFRNRSGARAVFEEVDRLLAKATASVPMMDSSPGLINLGLDELAAALQNNDSRCIFGAGSGYGPHRAEQAARAVLESPLVTYHGALRFAHTVIIHIAGGDSLSISEIQRAMDTLREALANENEVQLFFGVAVKPNLGDEMRITLIASIDSVEFRNALTQMETTMRPVEEDLTGEELLPEEREEETTTPEDFEKPSQEDDDNGEVAEEEPEQQEELPQEGTDELTEEVLEENTTQEQEGEEETPEPGDEPLVRSVHPVHSPSTPPRQMDLFGDAPRPNDLTTEPGDSRRARVTPAVGMPRTAAEAGESQRHRQPEEPLGYNRPYMPPRRGLSPAQHYHGEDLDTPPSMRRTSRGEE